MQLEATEHYQKALEIYDRLVEEDPNNNVGYTNYKLQLQRASRPIFQFFQSYRKRKVAVLLAQGKRLDAIRAINEYLKVWSCLVLRRCLKIQISDFPERSGGVASAQRVVPSGE